MGNRRDMRSTLFVLCLSILRLYLLSCYTDELQSTKTKANISTAVWYATPITRNRQQVV